MLRPARVHLRLHHGTSLGAAAIIAVGACIASAPDGVRPHVDVGGGSAGFDPGVGGNTGTTTTSVPGQDPHAVTGVAPPHGAFTGGTSVIVSGKGFAPDVRVWFGDVEAAAVVPISPSKVQAESPPGDAGAVAVASQNGDDVSTRRSLPAGFTYDALYAEPSTGPLAGGTVVSIHGQGTAWDASSVARIDLTPCTAQTVVSPVRIDCVAPAGTGGAKSISVATGAEMLTALEAYTYADSADGFKGGLSGAPLAGTLKVLALDNYSGQSISGAHVIVGSDLASGLYAQTDASGVALFDAPALDAPVSVTVAASCHSPITFVDVPVDTVTSFLNPMLTPECASDGDPPPVGGKPTDAGSVTGELVWDGGQEFQKGPWSNVPAPIGADEAAVAYVLVASADPEQSFNLPSAATAVHPDTPGDLGYAFTITAYPGNLALYALAGIERTTASGRLFTAYAMGIVRGVNVQPGAPAGPVYVKMSAPFDQALQLDVAPPPISSKGPDRLRASVAVEIAHKQYAILPGAQKSPLLPLSGPLGFVGLPPLDGDLDETRYVASARAVTGPAATAPLSVVSRVATTTTAFPLAFAGFVAVPALVTPEANTAWDGRSLAVQYPAGGYPVDLTVYELTSGNGLVRWVVAAPYATHSLALPDLSGFELAHLPSGPITVAVYGAHIDDFDYGLLRYRNLRPPGMSAYALDYFNAHLP